MSLCSANNLNFGPGLLATLGKAPASSVLAVSDIDASSEGDQHRKQRKMLTPVFSIAHMREMVPIFYDVVHKVSQKTSTHGASIDASMLECISWEMPSRSRSRMDLQR